MRFSVRDENAFHARRDELVADLASWLGESNVADADAGDAAVALDWKWGYQDGALGRWTAADLEEFLLDWCPRKLSIPPEECAGFPNSIRAFMTFLADRGLLAPGSGTLSQLQRCCERNASRFVTKMSDPANYGLAKGLFAGAGGLAPGVNLADEATVDTLLERMQRLPPEALEAAGISGISRDAITLTDIDIEDETLPTLTVGPVEPPDPAEWAASAAASPALVEVNRLWEFCAPPGRPPKAVAELPILSWLVELAIDAGVLRRYRGKLVAVARWRELSPVEALDRLVDAAVETGLSGPLPSALSGLADVQDFVDEGVGRLLAELLDWRSAGKPLPVGELSELMVQGVSQTFNGLRDVHLDLVRRWVGEQLDRLVELGIVTVRDVPLVPTGGDVAAGGIAELTPAGVPVAV
ncbi:MAG TPA: hypothetical protein VFQ77_00190, partial [Pseudonocardiaceae bacterium]|nr:hypothetical protein [Pseudonocardiaceae bacterium]